MGARRPLLVDILARLGGILAASFQLLGGLFKPVARSISSTSPSTAAARPAPPLLPLPSDPSPPVPVPVPVPSTPGSSI